MMYVYNNNKIVSFKVADVNKLYPFAFFNNKNINHGEDFPWLEEPNQQEST
jgi:hypothetical protein